MKNTIPARSVAPLFCLAFLLFSARSGASTYGTLNNFDTVNVCEVETHGFEIELEDCHSSDITRTYNYNHYGVPKMAQDDSVPGHPVCRIRWESGKNPDGSWAAYTAIPAGPIPATNGHMFTNPNINFGGEHFGVSYRTAPGTVRYFWLIDDGAGNLVRSCQVQVSTPTFTYNPPAAAPAQVQARIEPPEPPEIPVVEFGKATWVRAIKTTTHNNNEVKLKDLVSDDPDDPEDVNWRNGEPDEIEIEWTLLQEEFAANDGGGHGLMENEAEDLPGGDEIITRRWEFYDYVGPLHPESREAIADAVAEDNLHGVGTKTDSGVFYDLENTIVVGEFLGAQMSAFDVDGELGLIDHLQDGEIGTAYPERSVVIGAATPFTASCTGDLPAGMSFNPATGILSGTPTATGEFEITVEAFDGETPAINRNYNFRIAALGAELPPRSIIETSVVHPDRGSAGGGGPSNNGTMTTVVATANAGFKFSHWTDDGAIVSRSVNYQFNVDINRTLVANFEVAIPDLGIDHAPDGATMIHWPQNPLGWVLQERSDLASGSWQDSLQPVTVSDGNHIVTIPPGEETASFYRLCLP